LNCGIFFSSNYRVLVEDLGKGEVNPGSTLLLQAMKIEQEAPLLLLLYFSLSPLTF
jgi:hypothetical protein